MTLRCPPCHYNCHQGTNCPARELDALRAAAKRSWWLEYACNGAPYVATIEARNEEQADRLARVALSREHPTFDLTGARLVACFDRADCA